MQASSGIYISNTPAVVDTVGQKTREEEVKGFGRRVIRTDEQKHANVSQNKNKGSGHTTYQKHPCAAEKKRQIPSLKFFKVSR